MALAFIHSCIRVRDIEASTAFYELLGFELTVNVGRDEPYDLGEGYNHMAITVPDLEPVLARLAASGVEPEQPPYHPGGRAQYTICFVADPDGYRIELVDGGAFPTPQDPEPPA